MQLDSNGLNMAISGDILPEEDMRALGFTDHTAETWYFVVSVERDITLNISIPKNGSRLRIEVLDEDFGQHYDYQEILKRNPKLPVALTVKNRVEDKLEELTDTGVITGFTRGMYI